MDIESLRSRFINVRNTDELYQNLADKLPFQSEEYKVELVQGSVKNFICNLHCQINKIDNFMASYNKKNQETLRKRSTKTNLSSGNQYSRYVYLRCHHNTRYQGTMNSKETLKNKPSKRFKNTDCPFTMTLKFKKKR